MALVKLETQCPGKNGHFKRGGLYPLHPVFCYASKPPGPRFNLGLDAPISAQRSTLSGFANPQ